MFHRSRPTSTTILALFTCFAIWGGWSCQDQIPTKSWKFDGAFCEIGGEYVGGSSCSKNGQTCGSHGDCCCGLVCRSNRCSEASNPTDESADAGGIDPESDAESGNSGAAVAAFEGRYRGSLTARNESGCNTTYADEPITVQFERGSRDGPDLWLDIQHSNDSWLEFGECEFPVEVWNRQKAAIVDREEPCRYARYRMVSTSGLTYFNSDGTLDVDLKIVSENTKRSSCSPDRIDVEFYQTNR